MTKSTSAQTKPTVDEVRDSLTGFDEIAIEKAFGKHFNYLDGTLPARGLVFVLMRRQGQNDAAAYQSAMELGASQVDEQFSEVEVVLDGDEPETEQGEERPGGE